MSHADRRRHRHAFRTPTRPGWHRHHLLPNHLRHYPDLRDYLAGFSEMGFSMDDFSTNGMFLPADEAIACATRLPLHRGPHRTYNAMVIDALDTIRFDARRAGLDRSAQMAAVRGLQHRLRHLLQLSAVDAHVALASRNPFGASVALAKIDAQTDALFAAALSGELPQTVA
ncbi:AHH domain-containing protein [Sphingomonas sp. SUN039]|uniref:AHH domain-containing protein n=1 Tax=Sphingomonas sp. SUN039 TaxID=2937787 RepID=UPI002164356D|nr:AHH domain-containing protein [Sphingomonas sp. SUN039]UVO53957.1 AHH domain-containing protein [Sphingomonas sp. SUN039]